MRKTGQGLLKKGFSIWTKIPGTGVSLPFPGAPVTGERLPGMHEWAPRPVIEQVAQRLSRGEDIQDIAKEESLRGKGSKMGWGTLGGGILGGLLGRFISGEAAVKPFKDIYEQGLGSRTLKMLSGLPTPIKILPLIGAGAGMLAGKHVWEKGIPQRKQQVFDISKGLLAEKVLQQNAINKALENVTSSNSLSRLDPITSHEAPPYVVTSGNMGV
jgi:hypothetical protein